MDERTGAGHYTAQRHGRIMVTSRTHTQTQTVYEPVVAARGRKGWHAILYRWLTLACFTLLHRRPSCLLHTLCYTLSAILSLASRDTESAKR